MITRRSFTFADHRKFTLALFAGVAVASLLATPALGQQTIYVNGTTGDDAWDGLCESWDGGTCGPKATIQAGINASVSGDTVIVADGVYAGVGNRDLELDGRAITLCSANGPEYCLIDCEALGRAFDLRSSPSGALVVGLTIANGTAVSGGGVVITGDGTIRNCVVRDCAGTSRGGGIAASGFALVEDCTVRQCTAVGEGGGINAAGSSVIRGCIVQQCSTTGDWNSSFGGGIFATGTPTVENCTVENNSATDLGAGVAVKSATMTLRDCQILGNAGRGLAAVDYAIVTVSGCVISGNTGGGVRLDGRDTAVTLDSCFIRENESPLIGGGILATNGAHMLLTNCEISENHSDMSGGGVACGGAEGHIIRRCVISGNTAGVDGGGIFTDGEATIDRCTITGNIAVASGGGLRSDSGVPLIQNSLIAHNEAEYGGGTAYPTFLVGCVIAHNTATMSGGGVSLGDCVYNCTIVENECGLLGGGISSANYMSNSVVWGNYRTDGDPADSQVRNVDFVDHSCVQYGWPGTNNISDDPQFVAAGQNDYHLLATSPCIDTGFDLQILDDVVTDLDGRPRKIDGNDDDVVDVDMGAYERRTLVVPSQLHVAGPLPNVIVAGQTGTVEVTLSAAFKALPGWRVEFTRLSGDFSFGAGETAQNGTSAVMWADENGVAAMTIVGNTPGPAMFAITAPETSLPMAFAVFTIADVQVAQSGQRVLRKQPQMPSLGGP